jgi:catechol 2,3-dioxygenase
MATDPLDIGSVIAAGAGHSWKGVPAGTTIGHVHLHVGSLEMAESFYHRALGFDKTVWNYPGALFMAAEGYHDHLGTNVWAPGPAPAANQAQLVEWELLLPSCDDIAAAGHSLRSADYQVEDTPTGLNAADPWGTRIQISRRYE